MMVYTIAVITKRRTTANHNIHNSKHDSTTSVSVTALLN